MVSLMVAGRWISAGRHGQRLDVWGAVVHLHLPLESYLIDFTYHSCFKFLIGIVCPRTCLYFWAGHAYGFSIIDRIRQTHASSEDQTNMGNKLNPVSRQAGSGPAVAMELDRIIVKGAREHNLKNIDVEIPKNSWWCSRACPGPVNPAWPLTRYSPKGSAGMWNLCPPMPGSSSVRWKTQVRHHPGIVPNHCHRAEGSQQNPAPPWHHH